MPEIDEELTITEPASKFNFHTLTDGDTLILSGLELTKEQAAALAWLVNHSAETVISVKIELE